MSQNFTNSYFYALPNEVLIKILRAVETVTLLNFCEVYECDYFLQDRNVIRTVNLSKEYTLDNVSQISKKLALEHITTLNVNCLYWIQAAKLRTFLTRLVNLETLYAIQTNLSLSSADTDALSKLKLKKLGVSMKRHDELGTNKLPTIETLYINVIKVKTLLSPLKIEAIFPQLRNFWIEVTEPCGKEILLHCLEAQSKNKIFCQVNVPIPSISFDHYGLTTYYTNRRVCQPYVMCCERLDAKPTSTFQLENLGNWKVLNELHFCKPYSPRDARRLYLHEKSLDDIFFEELNFYHIGPNCIERLREAVKGILKSPSASHLKKLHVMMCLLLNQNAQESVNVQDPNSFTRKRKGVENCASSHPVEEIFQNFPGLKHLEIISCHGISHHSTIPGYPLISLFENLEILKLEVPITLDGSFLIEVLKKCKSLQILKLTSATQHEKLNFNICNAIPSATSLKDFRYENHRIHLDRLIERLCLVKSRKLERIVLMCKEIDKFTSGPLKNFLELNPQLIFLYFVIRECTEASIRRAQQTLNIYKTHPAKVFLIKKTNVFDRIGYPIPDVHGYEMVQSNDSVATLTTEDFEWF